MSDDEKKKPEMPNKVFRPAEDKKLRIKIRPGRSVTGVTVDAEGYALVDAKTADYLYKIGYAVKED
jgi:hypothetical protein